MKRLLCVLMVMVMAILMVPTIAGASTVWNFLYDSNKKEVTVTISYDATETTAYAIAPKLESSEEKGRKLTCELNALRQPKISRNETC